MASHLQPRLIEILLVEDNPADVRLTQEALSEAQVPNRLHTVADGIAAIEYLRETSKAAHHAHPDLILLDLNLPKKNGFEVLKEIKTDERWKRIPVIVMTSSRAEQDILASYDLHVNAYVTKPLELEQFISVVKSIESFWLETVVLPPDKRA